MDTFGLRCDDRVDSYWRGDKAIDWAGTPPPDRTRYLDTGEAACLRVRDGARPIRLHFRPMTAEERAKMFDATTHLDGPATVRYSIRLTEYANEYRNDPDASAPEFRTTSEGAALYAAMEKELAVHGTYAEPIRERWLVALSIALDLPDLPAEIPTHAVDPVTGAPVVVQKYERRQGLTVLSRSVLDKLVRLWGQEFVTFYGGLILAGSEVHEDDFFPSSPGCTPTSSTPTSGTP